MAMANEVFRRFAPTFAIACLLGLGIFTLFNPLTLSDGPTEEQQLGHSITRPIQLFAPLKPASGKAHVMVTGGAGYIGSHAALTLLESGHAVTVVDNLSRGNKGAVAILEKIAAALGKRRFQFANVDMGDLPLLNAVFKQSNVDIVMHFAAVCSVEESVIEPELYYSNITSNTVHLLQSMKAAKVNKLIYSSTCATYGTPKQLPVTEDSPTQPVSPYGTAKLMAEKTIRDFAAANPGFKSIIFRYFNVYGTDPQGRIGEWNEAIRLHPRISHTCLEAALGLRDKLVILGTKHPTPDGTCVRDYIHVMDLVHAHALGINHLANPPKLYNIGTGKGVSVREFVQACLEVTGKPIKVVEHAEARAGDAAAIYNNATRIQTELQWRAQYTDVRDGLRHAWQWVSKNPTGYNNNV